ncbi:MAG: methyltransferase domain-containing protein [Pedosphaera sp.]|nr:methyltransferase domain-containing protein [Pedosphaera sp.]
MAFRVENFYLSTLKRLIKEGVMNTGMRVLAVCASGNDHRILLEAGFKNVTLTNLETRFDIDDPGPHQLASGDVEDLTYPADDFDFVIAHYGLHHCASPHRGLLEMHRVAKYGLLVFEPRDSLLSNLSTWVGIGQEYETAAVALSADGAHGGWRNGPVPNFVYRWTEREIEKTIHSATPWMLCRFNYAYAIRPPSGAASSSNPLIRASLRLAIPLSRLLALIFPSQTNCFAFAVIKPSLPEGSPKWVRWTDGRPEMNPEWAQSNYKLENRR